MSDMPLRTGVRVEFKPQDLWVGVFWKTNGPLLDVWVCLLPMLPIHVRWMRHMKPLPTGDLTDEEWEAWYDAIKGSP